MIQRGYIPSRLARACDVNPKNRGAWFSFGRVPRREACWTIAHELDVDEVYLGVVGSWLTSSIVLGGLVAWSWPVVESSWCAIAAEAPDAEARTSGGRVSPPP